MKSTAFLAFEQVKQESQRGQQDNGVHDSDVPLRLVFAVPLAVVRRTDAALRGPASPEVCQRKTEGRTENRLANVWRRKRMTKKAHAARGQEIKWGISIRICPSSASST
jgi:hypothetical protein